MKKIVSIILFVVAFSAIAQVTNKVDLVWSDTFDDLMRTAWRADNNARTNGLAPYAETNAPQTYKEYLAVQIPYRIQLQQEQITSEVKAQQMSSLQEALTRIQSTNTDLWIKVWNDVFRPR